MSCDKKKNSLLRPLLKPVPGMSTGPPSVHAVVVERVERRLALGRLPESALLPAAELVAVQRVVALVVRGAAAEVLRPAARDDGDRRAGAAAVLGLEVRRLDADFGDRVERGSGVVAAVRAGVLVRDAVVREVEPPLRPLIDRLPMLLPTRRLAVARVDDARQQLEHAGEVAPLERDVLDVVARDQARSAPPFVVCTCTASAWTVTVSATPPTSSAIARSATRSVDARSMPFCSYVLNPLTVTVMLYLPASRSGNTNEPSAPVTVSRVALVPAFLMVTVAPGSTPPPESVTVPEIWPVNPCARTELVAPTDRNEHRDDEHHPAKTRCHVALLHCQAPSTGAEFHPPEPTPPGCLFKILQILPWLPGRRGGYARITPESNEHMRPTCFSG